MRPFHGRAMLLAALTGLLACQSLYSQETPSPALLPPAILPGPFFARPLTPVAPDPSVPLDPLPRQSIPVTRKIVWQPPVYSLQPAYEAAMRGNDVPACELPQCASAYLSERTSSGWFTTASADGTASRLRAPLRR